MSRNALFVVAGLLLVGIFGFQMHQVSGLKSELAAVRAEISSPKPAETKAQGSNAAPSAARANTAEGAGLQARLAYLERTVGEFTKLQQMLSDRGMMPPSDEKI